MIVDGGTDDKAKIEVVDAGFDTAVQPVIGGTYSGAESVATIRSKTTITNADGKEVDNLLMTQPTLMNVGASDLVESADDPEMEPQRRLATSTAHSRLNGDYVSPFNLVPQLIASFDANQTEFAITQEDPTNERLTVNTVRQR